VKLEDIRRLLEGRLEGDPDIEIRGIKGITEAGEGDITFLSQKKYRKALKDSRCSAVLAPWKMTLETEKAVIKVKNPTLAFAKLLHAFYPPKPEIPGVSSESVISKSAILGEQVTIYPLVYIGGEVTIGDHSVIYPGGFIGDNVKIGAQCVLFANVSIYPGSVIGDRVRIHSGAVIGSDGFGYVAEDEGKRHKVPQVGRVVIEDDVEVGANTCIDRATIGETRILQGVKLDNLVQIAHNCEVGENTVMAAQVGISGSCRIGKRAMLGGQVGVADHVNIGNDVMIVAQSGVPSDLEGNKIYAGSPTVPHKVWRRSQVSLPRLPELIKNVRSMGKRLEEIEKK